MNDICLVYSGDVGKPGGGTDRISAFAAGLSEHGHDVALVTATPTGPLPDRLEGVDVITTRLTSKGVTNQLQRAVLLIRRARAVASERDAKLQVTHSPLAGMFSLAGHSGFVLDMHDLVFTSPLYERLPFTNHVQRGIETIEKRGARAAAAVVVVSPFMKEYVVDRWNVPAEDVFVVPNGYFRTVRESYARPYSERVRGRVVFIGMFHPKVDVEAFRRVARLPAVEELVLIGDGPKYDALEASDVPNIVLPGRLPDRVAFDLVSRAEVAINPQHRSNLQKASSPVKLFLYAGLGVPTVATAGPDIVDEYARKGALEKVAADDSVTFAERVKELMDNDDRREEMTENATAAAADHTWSSRADALAEVYSKH